MTDTEPTDIEYFFAKIDWEGGVFDALEYGLKSEYYSDLPKELADDWDEIRELFGEMQELTDTFRRKWEPESEYG